MRTGLPIFIHAWFAVDLALALFPPLHWWVGNGETDFGIPRSLIYHSALSVVIAASVVVAYFCDGSRNGR